MRSGTSLLQHVLCASPQANPFVHGCRYLTSQILVYAQYAQADQLYIKDYLGDLQGLTAFTKDLLHRLLQETHEQLGRPDWLVLKNPELSIHLRYAAELFPQARFVITVRDPKDTIASMIKVGEKHRQSSVKSFLAQAGRNIDKLSESYLQFYLPVVRAIENDRAPLRDRILLVNYESLVRDTESEALRLSRFCGFTIPIDALQNDEGWRSRINRQNDPVFDHPRWSAYITPLVGKRISDVSVGRHHQVLTKEEATRVDHLCGDIQQTLNRQAATMQV